MPARKKSAITASGNIVTKRGRRGTSRSYFAFADSGTLEILGYEVRDGTMISVVAAAVAAVVIVEVVATVVSTTATASVDGGGDSGRLTHSAD